MSTRNIRYLITFISRFYIGWRYLGTIFVHEITLLARVLEYSNHSKMSSSPRRLRTIAGDIETPLRFYERLRIIHDDFVTFFVDCIVERQFNIGMSNIEMLKHTRC